MNEADTIIVGTDGSRSASAAVVWAAEEAVRHGRPLHIVHVQEPVHYRFPSGSHDARPERILQEARTAASQGRPGLVVTTSTVQGELIRSLRDITPRGAELVLGRRGGGTFDLLLGSTSLRLAGHAPRPVVVVRGDTVALRGEVVVGVALDHDPRAALTFAFAAARVRGARLRAVHAWDVSDTFVPLITGAPGFVDPLDRLADLLTPWRERNADVKVVEELVTDHPVAALTEASAGADLLVVGSHGRGLLGGALLGSVGHGVLHHAHCPVAVVPAH